MEINDILIKLGLDLTNPETKRGALEAINAILGSRTPPPEGDFGGGGGGVSVDVEIDPDLIQPSQKYNSQSSSDDVEIDDEDDLLSKVKHNDSEDDFDNDTSGDNENSSEQDSDGSQSQADSENEDGDDNAEPNDNINDDAQDASADDSNNIESDDVDNEDSELEDSNSSGESSEEEPEEDSEATSGEGQDGESGDDFGKDLEDSESDDIDDEDILDTSYDSLQDETIKNKQNARKIKRERTLQAAKAALDKAKIKRVAPALIRELEASIAALEELTEAISRNINDLSDDEFNLLINRALDAIDAVGDTSITHISDEERELKAQEIKADMSNRNTAAELSDEDTAKIRAEHQAAQAREKETNKYKSRGKGSFKGFQDFLNSLYRAIALQVHTEETNDSSWSALSRRNSGVGVLQQGKKINELPDKKIPVIDFYFDQSGSWEDDDIAVGMKAVSQLADMEANGQIKVNVYYFSDDVFSDAASARKSGGTSGWNEIVKNVIATQATNVIIMTDDDMENWWHGPKALSYTVPGYVWYLWRDGENAPRLPRDLKGRGGTMQFAFNGA